MNCHDFEDNMAPYIDGFPDGDLKNAMDEHRAKCPACARLAEAHSLVVKSLNMAEPVKAPAVLADRILAQVEAKAAGEKAPASACDCAAFEEHVAAFIKTDIARAILDMNRREDERRADGVVKTETIYKVPIYCKPLPESIVNTLLESYHRPYHKSLVELAKTSGAILGIDCHTMAAKAPPIEADAGRERPPVCIGDAEGSLPAKWRDSLVRCFENVFKTLVTVNDPFSGGYITRTHAAELPWVQVELSRAPFMTNQQKSECVLTALHSWCEEHSGGRSI